MLLGTLSTNSLYAQELLPAGEKYINEEHDVFILTPEQAQQVIYWRQDSDKLQELAPKLDSLQYQLDLADSMIVVQNQQVDKLEQMNLELQNELQDQRNRQRRTNIMYSISSAIVAAIIASLT